MAEPLLAELRVLINHGIETLSPDEALRLSGMEKCHFRQLVAWKLLIFDLGKPGARCCSASALLAFLKNPPAVPGPWSVPQPIAAPRKQVS